MYRQIQKELEPSNKYFCTFSPSNTHLIVRKYESTLKQIVSTLIQHSSWTALDFKLDKTHFASGLAKTGKLSI